MRLSVLCFCVCVQSFICLSDVLLRDNKPRANWKGDFNLIVSNFEHERINADYYCLLFTVPKFDEFDPKM